jgi:hypothetical protein
MGVESDRRTGYDWCFCSTRDLEEKWFKFWSHMTINRAIQSLVKQNLIIEDNFNKARWLRLNIEGLNALKSLKVDCDTTLCQNVTAPSTYVTGSNKQSPLN